ANLRFRLTEGERQEQQRAASFQVALRKAREDPMREANPEQLRKLEALARTAQEKTDVISLVAAREKHLQQVQRVVEQEFERRTADGANDLSKLEKDLKRGLDPGALEGRLKTLESRIATLTPNLPRVRPALQEYHAQLGKRLEEARGEFVRGQGEMRLSQQL